MDGAASEIHSLPPLLGEHTAQVLRELGLSDLEVQELVLSNRVLASRGRRSAGATMIGNNPT